MTASLTDLVYEHPETGGIIISPTPTPASSQSVECLLEPTKDSTVCHSVIDFGHKIDGKNDLVNIGKSCLKLRRQVTQIRACCV